MSEAIEDPRYRDERRSDARICDVARWFDERRALRDQVARLTHLVALAEAWLKAENACNTVDLEDCHFQFQALRKAREAFRAALGAGKGCDNA